jgi:NADPH-dependent 2,4-dienoyl-CoA reductase/sulfur reductase-like enzyme/rhodanese-related sulfurtransferase
MRIVIVGGVAGGAAAATRARRLSEEAEIILFERGGDISFANCGLPYYLGGEIQDRSRLLIQTPEGLRKRHRVEARVNTEVVRIDREHKTVVARELETGREHHERYDKLILSPGAGPMRPPIPGLDLPGVFTLRNLNDTDRIHAFLNQKKPQRAVVVGGGYIGLEMAEAFRHRGLEVVLVEMANQVMAPLDLEMAAFVHEELSRQGVELRLGTSVKAFAAKDGGLAAQLSTGESLACDIALVAIGVKPDVPLAREAGLKLGERGGIAVDECMRTSDPDIYAVGDAVEVTDFVSGAASLIPLAGPASRQGRIAADHIFGRPSRYSQTQGTAICKIFSQAAAVTGANEKTLKRLGRAHEKVYVHPASHASYYPGAVSIHLKLLFDPGDGKILGAQAVGPDGVDKRIDVLAVALRAGLTVYDLENLELAYAPPYGSAKDPVNYAGFVAANVLRGDVAICHADEVARRNANQVALDVRSREECEAGTVPGALNIPIDELRDRLKELDRSKEYLAYCQVGVRGYHAARILKQNGFRVRNLAGGYVSYKASRNVVPETVRPSEPHDDSGSECRNAGCSAENTVTLDACGIQCPGPIIKLKEALDRLSPGERIAVRASDPGFAQGVVSKHGQRPERFKNRGRVHRGRDRKKGGVRGEHERSGDFAEKQNHRGLQRRLR